MSPLASGKCLQRNMKPGQGSCCSSFFVVPPYANPVSASWHGQLAWLNNPSWIATWSGLWLEVEVERAAPPAQTLLALPQVPAGGRPGSFGPTELDHNCSFGLRAPGLVLLLAPLGGPAVLLLLWLVGPGQVGSTLHECNLCLYLALEFRAAVYPRGTHRSSSQLALGWGCGWGWETGRQGTGRGWGAQSHWEQLAPPLAGKGSGREVEGLSAGLPGGCMPTAECRWADSWPGAVGQLESWSARRETGPGAAYSESSHPGGHPPPSHGGCVAQNSAGLPAGCQEQGSGREMQVCGWHKA